MDDGQIEALLDNIMQLVRTWGLSKWKGQSRTELPKEAGSSEGRFVPVNG